MTKSEFLETKQSDPNILEILDDSILNNYSETCKEYILRYIELNQENKIDIVTIQYFDVNDIVYMRA